MYRGYPGVIVKGNAHIFLITTVASGMKTQNVDKPHGNDEEQLF